MSKHYCKKYCGGLFIIEEWNKAFRYCNENNIEGEERDSLLNTYKDICEKQCFDCMAEVGERRLKTKKLMEK